MKRRTFISSSLAALSTTITGCSTESKTNSKTHTPTPTAPNADIVQKKLEITSRKCLSENEEGAEIIRFPDRILIKGTFRAPNPCYNLKFDKATYSPESGRIQVNITSNESKKSCLSCVGLIHYHATIVFDKRIQPDVTLLHEGDKITNISYSSEN